jgi:arabinogalactan oligomer / maltooligosaccharide transport system permease protein
MANRLTPLSAPLPTFGRAKRTTMVSLIVKIVLLGLVDAFGVQALFTLFLAHNWFVFSLGIIVLAAINYIYLVPGALPAKYLTPGLFFLAIFQVFVVLFTGYIAFTNYSDGHNSTKDDAINSIIQVAQQRVPDSPQYAVTVLDQNGTLYLLVTEPDGSIQLGGQDQPLAPVSNAQTDGTGRATGLDGYTTLNLAEIVNRQDGILALSVPFSADPNAGSVRTPDGSKGYVYKSDLIYDATADTFTNDLTGAVFIDDGHGSFRSASGDALTPGWRVNVGFENFVKAFTNDQIGPPLLRVVLWTFAFAILSVLTTFALGLFLALVFNGPNLRFKRIYRILIILPYAFPAFLSGLVFAGLLNPEFGFVNQVFFGGLQIPWLSDPWLARFSVLLLNLWLGYPYMFLVCTGALQSIPDELTEAARVDGASPFRVVRSIKLPLLLVSVAPVLIASFAFNFNNFNVIYMLTKGWPRFTDTTLDIGSTDIMITLVYKIAFGGGGARDYGLASAFSILIFILVATVSAISFKRTRALEEVY